MIFTFSLGIWIGSLVLSAVALLAFGLWACLNRIKAWIVLGLFPGVVGLSLVDAGLFGLQVLPLPLADQTFGMQVTLTAACLVWTWFVAFLVTLTWPQKGKVLSRVMAGLGAVVIVASWTASTVPLGANGRELVLAGLEMGTLVIATIGIVALSQLKVDRQDSREKVELKHVFQPMAWVFCLFFPAVMIESLWPGPRPLLGYRNTIGALEEIFFLVLYLRFFYRWVALRVASFQDEEVGTVGTDQELWKSWGISSREAEVIALVSRGLANKEIAAELCISASTVKNHLSRIFTRLDVHSRVALLNKISALKDSTSKAESSERRSQRENSFVP